jgi:hypothetical protein
MRCPGWSEALFGETDGGGRGGEACGEHPNGTRKAASAIAPRIVAMGTILYVTERSGLQNLCLRSVVAAVQHPFLDPLERGMICGRGRARKRLTAWEPV